MLLARRSRVQAPPAAESMPQAALFEQESAPAGQEWVLAARGSIRRAAWAPAPWEWMLRAASALRPLESMPECSRLVPGRLWAWD